MSFVLDTSQRQHASHAVKGSARRALEHAAISQKAVAIRCQVDGATMSRWLDDAHAESIPLWALQFWTAEAGPRLFLDVAAKCGFEVSLAAPPTGDTLAPLTGMLAGQAGRAIQQLVQVLEDGQVTVSEAQALLPDLQKLKTTVDTLTARVGGVQ